MQTVLIDKIPGYQPTTLQVHGDIANNIISLEILYLMELQFMAAASNDLMARIASGEIDTKEKKLLDRYAEELNPNIWNGLIYKFYWFRGVIAPRPVKSAALKVCEPVAPIVSGQIFPLTQCRTLPTP